MSGANPLKGVLGFFVHNIYMYVVFRDQVFQQSVAIPMGMNCAPLLANIWGKICSETDTG
jgi:hypothetical protein